MTSFIGDYGCKVDEKGRVLFPAAFKKQTVSASPDRFVVKKDIFESCLVLFPMEEWERQNTLIRKNTNPYNKEHNKFLREFYRGTAEVTLDSSGRLLIPKRLLELVGAERELILAGMDGKIEIWAKDKYEGVRSGENEFAQLAEKIMGSSIIKDE
ncbi:MAG: division/cell wall cluster transcriptional repressor MraZ [Tenuifilaceae bacterium]